MTAAVLAGLTCGVGVWLLYTGLRPRPEPLAAVLGRWEAPPPARDETTGLSWDNKLGRFVLAHVAVMARVTQRVRTDLRVMGRRPEDIVGETVVYVLFGLMLGPGVGLGVWLVGASFPAFGAGGIALTAAAVGGVAPWLSLRDRAARRRASFQHALIGFGHVTAMSLGAGRGVDQAMTTAAAAGQGWAFSEIRGALNAGYVRRETPWESLERLGVELGLEDLSQLAAAIALSGKDGAAVRETVLTKAKTIRERVAADAEQKAQRATAQMGPPAVALAAGFVVFLVYPALAVFLDGF